MQQAKRDLGEKWHKFSFQEWKSEMSHKIDENKPDKEQIKANLHEGYEQAGEVFRDGQSKFKENKEIAAQKIKENSE